MNKHDLKVGQTVYLHRTRGPLTLEPMEVTKVGRVWATLALTSDRLNVETLRLETSGSRAWLSEAEYENEHKLSKGWEHLRRDFLDLHYRRPDGVTLADIEKAREVLKLGPHVDKG